jgi:hypothetical protein
MTAFSLREPICRTDVHGRWLNRWYFDAASIKPFAADVFAERTEL